MKVFLSSSFSADEFRRGRKGARRRAIVTNGPRAFALFVRYYGWEGGEGNQEEPLVISAVTFSYAREYTPEKRALVSITTG